MRIYQIEIEHVQDGARWALFTYQVAAKNVTSALKKAYAQANKDAGALSPGELNVMSVVWLNRVTYIS